MLPANLLSSLSPHGAIISPASDEFLASISSAGFEIVSLQGSMILAMRVSTTTVLEGKSVVVLVSDGLNHVNRAELLVGASQNTNDRK